MNNMIFTREYPKPDINYKEICKYYGALHTNKEVKAIIDNCISESENSFTYKVCFGLFPLKIVDENIDLGFTRFYSKNLAVNLSKCKEVIVFSATVGVEIDRLIARYTRISPTKSLCFQAIGTERIEALCDIFCKDLKTEYGFTKTRFSPGYGDLSLDCQKDIFRTLDCERKIGLTLTDSLLMIPSKSVTAFVGLKKG